jgi:hypothetical protein
LGLGLIERDETVRHPSLIDFVICGQKNVEKETKVACGGIENPDIAMLTPFFGTREVTLTVVLASKEGILFS